MSTIDEKVVAQLSALTEKPRIKHLIGPVELDQVLRESEAYKRIQSYVLAANSKSKIVRDLEKMLIPLGGL